MVELSVVNQRQWEILPFTDFPEHDSIWSMVRGADGHIYIGLCREYSGGGVAQLFRYNVRAKRLEHCLDMAAVCGEPGDGTHAPQGKIHFSLCAASDGRLYGTTHCTTPPLHHKVWNPYGMWNDPVYSYPGGHLFRYDPATGEAVDFGIPFPNEGIPFMVFDEARGRFYGVTYPRAHFFRMDLTARGLVDYGRISSWYPIGLCLTPEGNVFTSDTNSQLIKYDVAQDRVLFSRQTPHANPWNKSKRFSWISNLNLADDGLIYGTHYHNPHLFRFDPKEDLPRIEDLGDGVLGDGYRMLRCLVPDGRGHIYYIAYPVSENWEVGTRLWMRYDIERGRAECLGALRVGRCSPSSWIGVTDAEGNIYIKGSGQPMTLAIYHPNR